MAGGRAEARPDAVIAPGASAIPRSRELFRPDGRDRRAGPRPHSRALARVSVDEWRGRRPRAVQLSRGLEPRAVRREVAARAVRRRRRARARGIWHLTGGERAIARAR